MKKSQLLNFFRVTLLFLIFSAFTTSAWGAATVTIYFDNTNTQWPEDKIYLYMGHGGYSRSDWQMTKVSGNIFKCDNVTYWDDATQIAFAKDQWSKSGEGNSLDNRLPYQGEKSYTKAIDINKDDVTAYIYKPSLSNGVYSLTKEVYNAGGSDSGETPSNSGHKGTNVGFWDNEAWNIKVGDTWKTQSGYGAENNTEIDLGTIPAGTTIGFLTKTWKKKDVSNVCNPRVYVKITNGGTTIQDYTDYEISYSSESEKDGSVNQIWLEDNLLSLPSEVGDDYQMKVYFEMWGNENSKEGCNDLGYKLNNGEGNYIFNFKISESSSGDDDDTGECNTLYLKPTSNWDKAGARFVAYFFKDNVGHTWVNMEESSCSGIYKVAVPDIDLTSVIFVRMNGNEPANTWESKWNQTSNLTFSGSDNMYTISNEEGSGSWSKSTCTEKAECYTCKVENYDETDSKTLTCNSNNTKIIFRETFTFTDEQLSDNGEKSRIAYSVSNDKYSAGIPSYYAMTTPCSAIKYGGYYAMVHNPEYAGWGDAGHGDANCDTSERKWFRTMNGGHSHQLDSSIDETKDGMLLFNCKDGTDKCMPDILYECVVNDICPNTYINFSAYITRANTGDYADKNIEAEFRLLNPDNNDDILAVRKVAGELSGDWTEISGMFNSGEARRVKIQLVNKESEGIGNDILLDDITFSVCAPKANLVCSNGTTESTIISGQTETLTASIVSGVMKNPYYLWQYKVGEENWKSIGEAEVNKTELQVTPKTNSTLYRVIIAPALEDIDNALIYKETICGMYAVTNEVTVIVKEVSLESSIEEICENDKAKLELKVKNTLDVDLTNVKVTVNLPDGLEAYKSGTEEKYTNTSIELTISSLEAGTSTSLGIDLKTSTSLNSKSKDFEIESYISSINNTITYTYDKEKSKKAKLTVNQLPTAKFTVSEETICSGTENPTGLKYEIEGGTGKYTLNVTEKIGETEKTLTSSVGSDNQSGVAETIFNAVTVSRDNNATYTITRVTDSKGCFSTPIENNSATVTVEKIEITTPPEAKPVCVGDEASFSVLASGVNKYQWQISSDNNTWRDIEGDNAKLSEYTINKTSDSDNGYYRVVVSKDGGKCDAKPSNSALLTVKTTDKPTIAENGYKACELIDNDPTTQDDTNVNLSNYVTGESLLFYEDKDLSKEVSSGIIDGSKATVKTYYVTQTVNGCTSEAAEIPVTIYGTPTATLSGTPIICNGNSATLDLALVGKDGYKITLKDGSTTSLSTLSVSPTYTQTYNIGDLISEVEDGNGCKATLSGSATVTVKDIKITENIKEDEEVCADKTIQYEVKASGDDLKYQWYESIDNGVSFSPILNATSSSYETNSFNLTDTKQYYVEISQYPKYCENVSSNISKVTVKDCSSLELSYNLDKSSVCKDSEIILNLTLTNNSDVDLEDIEVTIVGVSNQDLIESVTGYDHTTGKWLVGSLDNKEGTNKSTSITIKIRGTVVGTNIETYAYINKIGTTPYNPTDSKANKVTKTYTVKKFSTKPDVKNYAQCPGTGSIELKEIEGLVTSDKSNLIFYKGETSEEIETIVSLVNTETTDKVYNYWVSKTKEGECESPRSAVSVTIYGTPTATLSGTPTICNGNSATLDLALVGKEGYTITLNDGSTTSLSTLSVSPTSTQTYNIGDLISEVKDGNGCEATLSGSAKVTVNDDPVIDFTENPLPEYCAGVEYTLPTPNVDNKSSNVTESAWYLAGNELSSNKIKFTTDDNAKSLIYKAKNTCGETTATFVASLNVADCADLTLVYTLDKSTYCKGDNATLTATITNDGDIDLKGVVLVQSWANLQENHDFDGKEWEIPLLTIGSSATLTITFNATVDEAFTIFVKKANDVTYGSYDVSVAKASVDLDVLEDSDPVTVNNYIACPVDNPEFPITDLVTSKNKDDLKVMGKDESTGEYYALTAVPMVNPSVQTSSTTYYITNTETGKCESTTPTPVTIEIYKPVTAKITAPKEICSGDNSAVEIALDGVAPYNVVYNNGTSDIPLGSENTSPVEINDKLTATTTYSLVSVEDEHKCKANISANDKATITVNELPTLATLELEDEDGYICEGSTTKLIATFKGTPDFSFNVNGIPYTSSNNTFELEISEAGDYVISALSDKNCSAAELDAEASTIHLYVEDIPEVSINPLSAELDCNTEEITLTASGANTYSWTDNKGSAAQTVASIVAQQTGSETIYTVVGTSQHGCTSGEVSVTVTENFVTPTVELKTKPQQDGSPMPTELNCRLKTIPVMADTENSPVEIVKYEWSNGGSVNEYNDLTAKGTYTVTVTGKNGCTASSTLEITENIVKPILSVEHIGSRTKETTTILNCNDQSVNITSSVSNVSAIGGSVEYFWYKDGDEYYYGETLEVFEDGTYKIVAVGKNNCESDFTVKLTKDDTKPKAEIVASAEMVTCSTPEVNLTVKTDVDCNYFWTGIVGEEAKKQTLKVEEGGTYTVFVQSNVNGCMTTLTHTLEQHTDLPTITIASSQDKVTCEPNTLTASGADSYVWSTGKTTESIEVTSGGTYTVTGTNEYGCENTAEIILEEDQVSPVIALTADTTHITCRKEIVTLTAEVTNADASRSYAYKWAQGSEDSDVTSNTFDAKEKATYKVIVTDQTNACFAEETIDVQENKQTPSIETKSLDAVCLPATVDIKDAITSTNAEEVKYFADKELIQELSTTEVEAAQDAKYYVVGYEFENNGCATEPIEIAINVKPVSAVPTVTNYDECAVEGTKTLSSLVTSDKTNLVFFADATSEEPIADEFDASAANTSATYWVSNTEANSCESERAQITVDIAGYIDFTLEASETRVPAGEEITVTLTPLTDTPVEQYIWTRNDDVISDSDETTISEQIYLTSKYAVQAVGRCNSPKQEVDIEAVWPTAFTPHNGNGKNDTFAKGMKLIVFNRFYTKIFEGPDGWDGTINGTMNESEQIAVPGVYYYSVQLPNGEVKKGTIEIVR